MRAPKGCALALAACVLLGGCAQQPEEPADPLAGWVGKYTYYAGDRYELWGPMPVFEAFDVDIYEQDGQYRAKVLANGKMLGIKGEAYVKGNEETILLVCIDDMQSFPPRLEEGAILLQLRQEGDQLITRWGAWSPLEDGLEGVYLERYEEGEDDSGT